jgi:phosphomannomutase
MIYKDKAYGLFIADSEERILKDNIPTQEQINKKVSSMILSASGWRKVFAESGDEEDDKENLSIEDRYIAGYVALSLAKHLGCFDKTGKTDHKKTTVLIGMDARPTGPAMSDIICRVLIALDIHIKNIFIAAAPEIMAYSALEKDDIDAFLYISASHNPVGHNGIKFGVNGGVYTAATVAPMIEDFKEFSSNEKYINIVKSLVEDCKIETYEEVLNNIPALKKHSLQLYRDFIITTAAKGENSSEFLEYLKSKISKHPIGIVAELNGSARGCSIDRAFFKEIGVKSLMANDTPRHVVHAIVPEGENLELCRTLLEEKYKEDKDFVVGYVPDNDGDRGNLVYIKKSTGKAEILKAQEVFALVVMAELSSIRAKDKNAKLAISVNGPTSMRIDEICRYLNVEVFRAEVGEANVVELAQIKRDEGYTVRILGEGSNGGNITNPAKVRDPLNTIMTLISLLTDESIFEEYRKVSKYEDAEISIENIIKSLPQYTTTDAFSASAKLHVKSSHGVLKTNYERAFADFFDKNIERFKSYGIASYKEYQMEGTNTVEGMGEKYRSAPYKGGLKITFFDENELPLAFIWMRGSGTEPVFRILVDCKKRDDDLYSFLLKAHAELITSSDM